MGRGPKGFPKKVIFQNYLEESQVKKDEVYVVGRMGWVFTKRKYPMEGLEERVNMACFTKYDRSKVYREGQTREKEAEETEGGLERWGWGGSRT